MLCKRVHHSLVLAHTTPTHTRGTTLLWWTNSESVKSRAYSWSLFTSQGSAHRLRLLQLRAYSSEQSKELIKRECRERIRRNSEHREQDEDEREAKETVTPRRRIRRSSEHQEEDEEEREEKEKLTRRRSLPRFIMCKTCMRPVSYEVKNNNNNNKSNKTVYSVSLSCEVVCVYSMCVYEPNCLLVYLVWVLATGDSFLLFYVGRRQLQIIFTGRKIIDICSSCERVLVCYYQWFFLCICGARKQQCCLVCGCVSEFIFKWCFDGICVVVFWVSCAVCNYWKFFYRYIMCHNVWKYDIPSMCIRL